MSLLTPVNVAEEVCNNTIIRIFRMFYLNPYDIENYHNLCWFLKINMNQVYLDYEDDNFDTLMEISNYLRDNCSTITEILPIMQETNPIYLLRFYQKICMFKESIHYVRNIHDVTIEMQFGFIKEYVMFIQNTILTFWQEHPEIFIRLPPEMSKNYPPDLFMSPTYLPYTLGLMPLPEWLDPHIVMAMNDARKIYQTREQTIERYKELVTTLGMVRWLPPDVIKLIVLFTPVDVIFDLMQSMTPEEFAYSEISYKYERFSSTNKHNTNVIVIHVS
jgi:hypothetical protein